MLACRGRYRAFSPTVPCARTEIRIVGRSSGFRLIRSVAFPPRLDHPAMRAGNERVRRRQWHVTGRRQSSTLDEECRPVTAARPRWLFTTFPLATRSGAKAPSRVPTTPDPTEVGGAASRRKGLPRARSVRRCPESGPREDFATCRRRSSIDREPVSRYIPA